MDAFFFEIDGGKSNTYDHIAADKIKWLANMLYALKAKFVCTIACRGGVATFRVFPGCADDIRWTDEGHWPGNRYNTHEGVISWASPGPKFEIIGIRCKNYDRLFEYCKPFYENLEKHEKGIVTYWE